MPRRATASTACSWQPKCRWIRSPHRARSIILACSRGPHSGRATPRIHGDDQPTLACCSTSKHGLRTETVNRWTPIVGSFGPAEIAVGYGPHTLIPHERRRSAVVTPPSRARSSFAGPRQEKPETVLPARALPFPWVRAKKYMPGTSTKAVGVPGLLHRGGHETSHTRDQDRGARSLRFATAATAKVGKS